MRKTMGRSPSLAAHVYTTASAPLRRRSRARTTGGPSSPADLPSCSSPGPCPASATAASGSNLPSSTDSCRGGRSASWPKARQDTDFYCFVLQIMHQSAVTFQIGSGFGTPPGNTHPSFFSQSKRGDLAQNYECQHAS